MSTCAEPKEHDQKMDAVGTVVLLMSCAEGVRVHTKYSFGWCADGTALGVMTRQQAGLL